MALAAVLDIPEDVLLESVGLTRPTDSIGGSIDELTESETLLEVEPSSEPEPAKGPPPVHVQMDESVVSAATPSERLPVDGEESPPSDEPISKPVVVSRPRVETHRTAIPPQPMLLVPPPRSYLEDRRQMTTYRIRAAMTIAILLGLLLLVEWGLNGAGHSLKEALSGLHP